MELYLEAIYPHVSISETVGFFCCWLINSCQIETVKASNSFSRTILHSLFTVHDKICPSSASKTPGGRWLLKLRVLRARCCQLWLPEELQLHFEQGVGARSCWGGWQPVHLGHSSRREPQVCAAFPGSGHAGWRCSGSSLGLEPAGLKSADSQWQGEAVRRNYKTSERSLLSPFLQSLRDKALHALRGWKVDFKLSLFLAGYFSEISNKNGNNWEVTGGWVAWRFAVLPEALWEGGSASELGKVFLCQGCCCIFSKSNYLHSTCSLIQEN